ncbi:Restriction endonuclease [Pseudomonas peli]|jgi:hypothetical protein|uniref:Restriction endonuclease n=1 Tax=Pseudomonas peli TaxID=592361 RepID=A0AB37ZAA6_9PSED|nr:restriction endonuclease [Pseudomonas peli]NMZ70529.1 restriction endonuclease [Pseudomonas peli]SCW70269.1 Restriction endonuclease [Pseudomonas peli]
MIENPKPSDWKDLQSGVCRILNEVGIAAETEKTIETPRGKVEIDVYGIDEHSVEKIKYIIECKNWGSTIPQAVVHSFTTVLHETGGHIGILISKEGFQEGALSYIQHTNIVALTYAEFQERYFKQWYSKYFCVKVLSAVDCLLQYVEPINSRRSRFLNQLDATKKSEYEVLCNKYQNFTMVMAMLSMDKFASSHEPTALFDIEDFKSRLVNGFGDEFKYKAVYYRDLTTEISSHAAVITEKFHTVFGRNIFA